MEQSEATYHMTLNAGEYSWQRTYFQLLHGALLDAFNELIPAEKNDEIEWKDDEMIKLHALESGLLEKTLSLAKEKFSEMDY